MTTTFDIAVIGAGAVGSAIARELSRYQLKVALIESAPDVGMGTSKASTAIWHTGFDAKPGTLEATLMRRSYVLMDQYLVEANIAHERLGALLIAWNQDQLDSLPALEKKAHENGVMDVRIISSEEIHQREPHINNGALGGLLVPGEVFLINNTIVNDRSAGSFLHLANGTARCFVRNTIFAGIGTVIVGAATTIDTSHNWNGSVAAAGFISASNYNYGLLATSPAINRGTDIGIVDNIPLTPSREYKHPKSFIEKKFQDSIDCGAHEYLGAIGVDEALQSENGMTVFPNPSNGDFMVQLSSGATYDSINLIDPLGRNVARGTLTGDRYQFSAHDLPNGVYYLYLQQNNQLVTRTVVIAR